MKFIPDKATDYLSVKLPYIGAGVSLLVLLLQAGLDLKLIPLEYQVITVTIILPLLAHLGRKIAQPTLGKPDLDNFAIQPLVSPKQTSTSELAWIAEARKHVGLKEDTRKTHHNTTILKWLGSLGAWWKEDETPWCFTGDTEILTEEGWQRFDDLKASRVYQADQDGGLSLTPYNPVVKDYDGTAYYINHRGIKITCDKGHRWWGFNGKVNPSTLGFSTLDSVRANGFSIPSTHSLQPDAPISDRDLQLLAAFISDGCLKKTGKTEGASADIVLEVSKPRKISYLRQLTPNHEYTQNKVYGELTTTPLTVFRFQKPTNFDEYFKDYKELCASFINQLSQRQAQVFISANNTFDGNSSDAGCILYTSRESGVQMLSHILVLAGYHHCVNPKKGGELSKKPFYYITYTPQKKTKTILKEHVNEVRYKGLMYCVSVPQGRIVVRGKGGAVVTGNCGVFVAYCLKTAGVFYPKDWYRALDYMNYRTKLEYPAYGCVAIKTRKGGGHVAFVVGKDKETGKLVCIGGNQNNMVSYALYAESDFQEFRWYGKTLNPSQDRYNLPELSGVTATKVTEA